MREVVTRRREQRNQFIWFLFFSVLEIGYLLYVQPDFSVWQHWLILGGAFFFPLLALLSFISMRRNWSEGEEDRAFTRTFGFIALVPVVLVGAVVAGVALYAAFGWFATIPSWAAVIIVLLVLIYLKKQQRWSHTNRQGGACLKKHSTRFTVGIQRRILPNV